MALKVPRAGLISSEKALARFEREVELAAGLKHPNIAQIHDSRIHQGIYYYAMDLIEGMHLDEYVKQHNLTVRQILELMQTICQAVQHAHQNGVIHRDLKPSNIIVTKDGQPYIVDFGLAKNLLEDNLALTVSIDGEVAGTPAYMSPEQAAGHIDKLDTRMDVYSLGVMLFTLLTGESPHDLSGSRYQVMRRIAEEQVRRPRKICPKIDKELELLLLKALDNEPDRRYAAAGMLAQDIDNYLTGTPLLTVPQSSVYQFKKFVRRNRALVTGIAVVLAVLVAGVVVSTLFAIGQARARAEAQAVSDFLRYSVIESLSLWRTKGRGVTIRSVLDAASQSLEGELTDRPLVEASIRRELGCAYIFLGLYEEAERHFQRVFEIYRAEVDTEYQETLISMWHVGWVYWWQGRLDEAEPMLTKALQGMELVLNEGNENRLYCMAVLAWVYNGQGCFNEAEQLFAKGRNTVRRVLGEEHEYSPTFMNGLACAYHMQGRYDEAERLFKEALKLSRRVRGEQDMETLGLMNNLGNLYHDQGRYDESEQLLVKALDSQRHVFGEQHLMTFQTMNSLARLYHSQGQYEQAKELLTKALEISSRTLEDEHPVTLESMNGLAVLYKEQGRYDDAERLLLAAVEGRRPKLGDEHPHTLESLNNLIELYEAWNKTEKAEHWREKLPREQPKEK